MFIKSCFIKWFLYKQKLLVSYLLPFPHRKLRQGLETQNRACFYVVAPIPQYVISLQEKGRLIPADFGSAVCEAPQEVQCLPHMCASV